MEPIFQFVAVDRILCDTITLDLESGRSVLILGSPGSGKYILATKVRRALQVDGAGPIIELNLQCEPPLLKEAEVREFVGKAAAAAGALTLSDNGTGMLSSLDGVDRCSYLLLGSVDSLGHHLVRQLLEELRERSGRTPDEPGRIVTLIAGEYDLRNFVYGPASEVTNFISQRYVLQGCNQETFDEFFLGFLSTMAMPLPDAGAREMIYRKTGGNAELAISVVNAAVAARQRMGERVARIALTEALIDEVLSRGPLNGLSDPQILRHALRLIPQEPVVWPALWQLRSEEKPPLKQPVMEPAALTLSGLAKRLSGRLEFASPIMEASAKRTFGHRYFGDLYAQNGEWETAINSFKALLPEERLRPINGGDLGPAQSTVRSARAWFEKSASKSSSAVRANFARVCQYVLGFPEVTFWQFGNEWQDISSPECSRFTQPALALAVSRLSETTNAGSPIALPLKWAGKGFACKLDGELRGRDIVALFGDFHNFRMVSPERSRLAAELLHAFIEAHGQATDLERRMRSRSFQEAQNEVASEILKKLDVEIVDVEEILRIASERFVLLDYRRIGFTLVNPTGDKVERVLEPKDKQEIPDRFWHLSEPGSGVHPWVVKTRKTLYIDHASRHTLTDKELVARREIQGFAVVPILGADGLAVGTIHVERDDRIVPSEDEGADFESFGRLLYLFLAQARRITLMQRSLDQTIEPHLIFDPQLALVYANKRAGELLKIDAGWRSDRKAVVEEAEAGKLGSLRQDVAKALSGRIVGHHEARFPDAPEFMGSLSAARITNSRGHTIGAFVHCEDLIYAERALRALECVAQAHDFKSALRSLLEAVRILKRDWARIYLVDPIETDVLVSHIQYGFSPGSDDAERFESHCFRFRHLDAEGGHGWTCIREGQVIVFRHTGDEKRQRTLNDIEVRGSGKACPRPMNKQENAYWIEAPLIAGTHVLGNISLGCDDSLKSEELHFLMVFFRLVSNLLDLHLAHEKSGDIKAHDARDRAWRTSLSLVSHNLATRTAGFGPVLANYKSLAKSQAVDRPELEELNQMFEQGYEEINRVMRKAKRAFRNKTVALKAVNVFTLATRAVADLLAGLPSPVTGEETLIADLDEDEVVGALKEIVENATAFAPRESVRVSVEARLSNGSEMTQIIVSDGGIGVPKESKERIFDDFFTDRPGREPGDGGLGLALVRRVVEAHGGRVWEDGTPGEGARFVMEFPSKGTGRENREDRS